MKENLFNQELSQFRKIIRIYDFVYISIQLKELFNHQLPFQK